MEDQAVVPVPPWIGTFDSGRKLFFDNMFFFTSIPPPTPAFGVLVLFLY